MFSQDPAGRSVVQGDPLGRCCARANRFARVRYHRVLSPPTSGPAGGPASGSRFVTRLLILVMSGDSEHGRCTSRLRRCCGPELWRCARASRCAVGRCQVVVRVAVWPRIQLLRRSHRCPVRAAAGNCGVHERVLAVVAPCHRAVCSAAVGPVGAAAGFWLSTRRGSERSVSC